MTLIPGSHSARSAWIETLNSRKEAHSQVSHSARSAWIETFRQLHDDRARYVALRKECVD